MKDIVLTGAGASIEAGVPGAFEMTKRLLELFSDDPSLAQLSHVLRFVVGGLLFQSGVRNENPFEGANVEDVFNAMQLLATRQVLEAAPFIGSWHPAVTELDVIRPDRMRFIMSQLTGGTRLSSYSSQLDTAITDLIKGKRPMESPGHIVRDMCDEATGKGRMQQVLRKIGRKEEPKERPGEGEVFEKTSEAMIQKLVDLVWVEERNRVEHLLPLVRFMASGGTIATLNYDNALELAAETAQVGLQTGIQQWSANSAFPKETSGIYLLKLHGSIDWSLKSQSPSVSKPLEHDIIQAVTVTDMKKGGFRPAVIFGQKNKLTSQGPFLEILRVFRERLFEAQRLIVIGYSFRDEHVNEYIAQWLNGDSTRMLTIINGQNFERTEIEFARNLLRLKSRVTLISKNASDGIREVFAQTALALPDTVAAGLSATT